jgi:hypothetical protein
MAGTSMGFLSWRLTSNLNPNALRSLQHFGDEIVAHREASLIA